MNPLKAKLLSQRIGKALARHEALCKQDVWSRYHFDAEDEASDSAAQDTLQRELDHYCIDNEQHLLSLGFRDAERLAQAAALRVHGDGVAELGELEAAGLTHLALVLDCATPAVTSATVDLTFSAASVTYEGPLDAFRQDLRVGANIAWDSQVPFRVSDARVTALSFHPRDDGGPRLRTCTLTGRLTLQVELVSDSMTLEERLEDVCVTLAHPQMQSRQLKPERVDIRDRAVG